MRVGVCTCVSVYVCMCVCFPILTLLFLCGFALYCCGTVAQVAALLGVDCVTCFLCSLLHSCCFIVLVSCNVIMCNL
jgi:hypothetical protein